MKRVRVTRVTNDDRGDVIKHGSLAVGQDGRKGIYHSLVETEDLDFVLTWYSA